MRVEFRKINILGSVSSVLKVMLRSMESLSSVDFTPISGNRVFCLEHFTPLYNSSVLTSGGAKHRFEFIPSH